MKNRGFDRWGIAAFVIGSIMAPSFFRKSGQPGRGTNRFDAQQRVLDRNPTTPANGTFPLVWSVVYIGHIGLVVHQALASQQTNPRYAKARPWWLANYALNALFGYFFSRPDQTSRVGASLTTIAMLPVSLGLHRSLAISQITNVPQPERNLRRSVSLYVGWLTAATVISVGNLLIEAGLRVNRRQGERWAYGVLPVTAGLGIALARRLNDPYYLAPFAAAFGGIAAKQWDKSDGVAVVSGVCALAVISAQMRQSHEPVSQPDIAANQTD